MEKPDFFSYDSHEKQKYTLYRCCTHVYTQVVYLNTDVTKKESKYVLMMEYLWERNSSEGDVVNLFKITIIYINAEQNIL